MQANEPNFLEVYKYAQAWGEKTERLLREEMDKVDIKNYTGDLREHLKITVKRLSESDTLIEVHFDTHGRFVDMGAGRKGINTAESNRSAITKRKPKKFYSPIISKRKSILQAVVGLRIVETILQEFKNK